MKNLIKFCKTLFFCRPAPGAAETIGKSEKAACTQWCWRSCVRRQDNYFTCVSRLLTTLSIKRRRRPNVTSFSMPLSSVFTPYPSHLADASLHRELLQGVPQTQVLSTCLWIIQSTLWVIESFTSYAWNSLTFTHSLCSITILFSGKISMT